MGRWERCLGFPQPFASAATSREPWVLDVTCQERTHLGEVVVEGGGWRGEGGGWRVAGCRVAGCRARVGASVDASGHRLEGAS